MNLSDPSTAKTREECAQMFCATITKVLTFSAKHITDTQCLQTLDEIKHKYRAVCDTVYTREQILENVGEIIIKWEVAITGYDDNFFMHTSLGDLIDDASGGRGVTEISEADRARFFMATTKSLRTNILNALNQMIILYARYHTL